MNFLPDINWTGFCVAVLLIELTPGPNMAWLAGLSLGEGRKAGFTATAGIALGLTLNALLAAFGLVAVISANPSIEGALRWAGVAMMLWLAWEAWKRSDVLTSADTAPSTRRNFVAGLFVNILNPKALLFFVAVLPPFLNNREPTTIEATTLAMVSVAIATIVHCMIVMGAGVARAFIEDARRILIVRRIMAAMLVGVAIWLGVGAIQ